MKLLISALALAASLMAPPAQAGLFDVLTGKDKPAEIDPDAPLTVPDFIHQGQGQRHTQGCQSAVTP